ncbi:hypothetical protein BAU22_22395 [Bacillus sp. 4048]|uniref:hypothetical protein n=1 Tax=Bacillus TaxID=1386 RepID=UPI0008FE6A6D|nr:MULTISPECIES: hypothetical protein [Bacillus]OJD42610.1 hypothetical protein BAU22_22395 [Bacillus sp. 4048]TCD35113.1 hypothetical protein E0D84_01255 [Bacillus wiedmannii]
MRNDIFINETILNSFVDQIPRNLYPRDYKKRKTVSFSLAGIKADISEENVVRNMNNHEKIELLLKYLKSKDALQYSRPRDMYDSFNNNGKAFVLETMKATQIIFPPESLKDTPDLKYFALWISDPNTSDIQHGEIIHNYTGTFLYITQMWLDNGWYSPIRSGCSALQAIVNYLEGRPILNTILHGGRERFGRSNFQHPIDKLISLGAKKGSTKEITCLYQKRYITNEQCYIFNSKETRVNDLLAYPIFISEEI